MDQFPDVRYSELESRKVELNVFQRLRLFFSRHRPVVLGSVWLLATALIAIEYSHIRVAKAMKLCGQHLFSPAQDAIDYDVRVFTSGFHDEISEFQGPPTPELDAAWEDLVFGGVGSWITHDEASRLANATSRFGPTYPELYVIVLDVFHQLHCLNTLRQVAYADQYEPSQRPPYLEHVFEHGHLSHCLDSIRQSLMCNADITPIVLQWDPEQRLNVWKGSMPHTCRRFDQIEHWAKGRAISSLDLDAGDWMDPDLSIDGLRIQLH